MADLRVPEKKFRPELEGVRVFAAFLVAVYHIWLGSVSGGVDVFFIVSGFLITTSLLSRMENQGNIQLFDYLLGLARRLFPLAFIVLFFSIIFSYLLLPQVQWEQIMSEIFASAFYYENWQLAFNAVDYLAQNNEASPLQHFWALSLQGQFYVIWPLVIVLAFFIAKKVFHIPFRRTLLAVLVIIFASSLTYSIYMTNTNQAWAYFDTFARVWEFSLGGILALLIPYAKVNKRIGTMIGWIGLAIICFTGIILPVSTVFPGYAALLPTTGVLLIIISAENHSRFGVKNLLGSKPLLTLGGYSYGFYLWHWPLLIFYYAYFKTDTVSFWHGVLIILVAFILAFLSTKIVEGPIRKLSVRRAKRKLIPILSIFVLVVLGANSLWMVYQERAYELMKQNYEVADYPGARVLYDKIVATEDVVPITAPLDANSELPSFYADDCYVSMHETDLKVCSYGETEDPEYTIALVGGSHSGHWFPALEQFAEELKLQIDVYNKDACRFSTQDFDGLLSESCQEWNKMVVEPLMENPPDFIFTTASLNKQSTVPEGYVEMWEKFDGITHIFAIRDNPRMEKDNPAPMCVETLGPDECFVLRSEALSEIQPWENTEGIPDNVFFADLSDYFCEGDLCPAVIGNVIVYRDEHHISTLYSMTLAEPLKKQIIAGLKWLEDKR